MPAPSRSLRALRRVLAVILTAAAIVFGALGLFLRATRAETRGTLTLHGLAGPVTILRDRYGVPVIEAGGLPDAAFALGFTHASERLWQMDTRRRAALGRLSEMFGEGTVETDLNFRARGFAQKAREDLAACSAEERAVLESYAAGVNAWIARRRMALPPEYLVLRMRPEPWRPEDSLAFLRLMLSDLSE